MKIFGFFFFLSSFVGLYIHLDSEFTTTQDRTPASAPANYNKLSACQRQSQLWDRVVKSTHKEFPDYSKMGVTELLKMNGQEIGLKRDHHSDFAPSGWVKYLHKRGAIAKVKIIPRKSAYTGLFQGADCGLLRLSLTYKPTLTKPVAPGLALKILRDNIHSANISALVSLDGQDKDYNFFEHPMSNIVPMGEDIGQKLVHKIFSKVTKYPEELLINEMASVNSKGVKVAKAVSPRQLFFVPNPSLRFANTEHDVRRDFISIPSGTVVYQVFAVSDKYRNYDYSQYTPDKVSEFLKNSSHIADVVLTSKFVASEFGDQGIFFRHQIRP